MRSCFRWFQPWICMAIVSLFETITLSASSSSRISDARKPLSSTFTTTARLSRRRILHVDEPSTLMHPHAGPNLASSARHASTPRRTCTYPQVVVAYSSCLRSLLPANTARMEDSPSGLWRTLGKRVGVTASRVRISYPPPSPFSHPKEKGFFISVEPRRRMAGIGRHKPLPPARNTIRPPAPHGENTQASAKR